MKEIVQDSKEISDLKNRENTDQFKKQNVDKDYLSKTKIKKPALYAFYPKNIKLIHVGLEILKSLCFSRTDFIKFFYEEIESKI